MEKVTVPPAPNYGLDLNRQTQELNEKKDYVFGAAPQCIALIPAEDREKYLPKGEVQKGREDFMDCASRGPVNILEAKFTYLYRQNPEKYKWLLEKGYVVFRGGLAYVEFSDRFIAIKSKTTRAGNSLKAPCHAVHTHGLIPKKMLPAKPTMTWAQYHRAADVTLDMDILGAQFLNRFPIFYELVFDNQRNIANDMRDVAGYAWPEPVDGIYPAVPNDPNHVFVDFNDPKYTIFDNYLDRDGDFIKRLAPDFNLLGYGYRLIVTEQEVAVDRKALDIIISFLMRGKTKEAMALINKTLGTWLGFAP